MNPKNAFSFQPATDALNMGFFSQSTASDVVEIAPEKYSFFEDFGRSQPVSQDGDRVVRKKKKNKKVPKECNRADCGELRTKNEGLERKVNELALANTQKIVHMSEKRDELSELKELHRTTKMAQQDKFDKAKMEWEAERGYLEQKNAELERTVASHVQTIQYIENQIEDYDMTIAEKTTEINERDDQIRGLLRNLKNSESEGNEIKKLAERTDMELASVRNDVQFFKQQAELCSKERDQYAKELDT